MKPTYDDLPFTPDDGEEKVISEYIIRETGYPGQLKQEVLGGLVRCKECKYGLPLTDANGITVLSCNYKNAHGMLVENHGFCKWGDRRE